MAATITPTPVTRSGIDITAAALTAVTGGGDSWAGTGQEFYVINNGDGSDHTVTFAIQRQVDGVTPTAVAHTVTAGKYRIFGPFSPSDYNDANGLVNCTYSAATSMKCAVLKCIPAGPGQ